MDPASLESLGVVVVERFLDRAACRRLVRALDGAPRRPFAYPDAARETGRPMSMIAGDVPEDLRGRLLALAPRFERTLGVRVARVPESYVLEYKQGDFCGPHVDDTLPSTPPRLVTSSLCLSAGYRGGRIVLHGLLGREPPWSRCGVPIRAGQGTLVAFRSSTPHEVEPVASGRRLSLVSFFY